MLESVQFNGCFFQFYDFINFEGVYITPFKKW